MIGTADAKIVLSGEDRTGAMWASAKRNIAGAQQQVAGLQESVTAAGARFGTLGVAIAAAFTGQSLKGAIDTADQLDDLAEKSGIAVKELSALRYAGEVVGTPLGAIATGVKKLAVNMSEAAGGAKEQSAVFKALNINIRELDGSLKGSDKVLTELADKFAGFRAGPEKAALAIKIFGKAGEDLIPLLNQGSAGLRKLRTEAETLGLVIGEDVAKASARFNDNLKRLDLISEGAKLSIVNNLLGPLNKLAETFISSRKEGDNFVVMLGRLVNEANRLGISGNPAGILASQVGKFAGVGESNAFTRERENIARLEKQLAKLVGAGSGGRKAASFDELAAQELAQVRRTKVERELADARRRIDTVFLNGAARGMADDPRLLGEIPRESAPIVDTDSPRKAASAYESLNAQIQKRLDLLKAEAAAGGKLTEVQRYEFEALAGLTEKRKDLTAEQYDALKGMVTLTALEMQAAKDREIRAEAELQNAKIIADRWEEENAGIRAFGIQLERADQQRLQGLHERVRGLEAEQQAAEVAARENVSLAEAVEMVAVARAKDRLERENPGNDAARQLQNEIEQREKLLQLLKTDRIRQSYVETLTSIDETARRVWTDVSQSGVDAFKRIGDTLKASVFDLLYSMVVRPWVIDIAANVIGSPASAVSQVLGARGGAGMGLASLFGGGGGGNPFGGVPLLPGFGGIGGGGVFGAGLNAGFGSIFGEAGLMGGLDAGITALGAGNIAGGLGTLAGALGPIAAGIAIIATIAEKTKGETRSGGQYEFDRLVSGPSGGELGTAGQQAGITAEAINATLAALGSSAILARFVTGLESSERGKGFAYAGGQLSGGAVFGQGWGPGFAEGSGYNNRRGDMTPEEATAAYQEELKQATLQAIQAATDIPESVAKLLRDVDIDALAGSQVDALLAQVNAMVVSVEKFRMATQLMPFDHLRDMSFDLAAALGDAAGGMDLLLSNLQTYYTNYFSAEEQRLQTARNIQRVLADAGASFSVEEILAGTKSQFRQVVEAFEGRTDEAGVRIYTALLSVNEAFARLVDTVPGAADAIRDAQEAFESASAIKSNFGSFVRNFYSGEEQRRAAATDIQGVLSAAGANFTVDQILNATKEQFRQVTEAFAGRTDDPGKRLYAALLSVNEQFALLADSAPNAADAVQQAADAARERTQGALDVLERAVSVERAVAEAARQAAAERVSDLRGLFELLKDSSISLFDTVEAASRSRAGAGRSFIDQALGTARSTGYLPESDALQEAIDAAINGLEGKRYSSRAERDFDRLSLANQLRALEDIAGPQLSAAELQLKASEEQVRQLDETLEYWRRQVELSTVISAGISSVADAVRALGVLLGVSPGSGSGSGGGGAVFGPVGSGSVDFGPFPSSGGAVFGPVSSGQAPIKVGSATMASMLNSLDWAPENATASTAKVAQWMGTFGWTPTDLATVFPLSAAEIADHLKRYGYSVPGYAGGGSHGGGLRLVGERGPELEYTPPSYIFNAQDTFAMMRGGGGNRDICSQLEKLDRRLNEVVTNTAEASDRLRDFTRRPLRTRAM
ncbi:hypothetical protein FN976_07925 [Caenimonas sedimenti]|uniref:Bacteriophage tail tape measure N-terminal domain-containing protein n=1 Tax=Caenimonas sedimenti TaxID=2596921 RepID=A0A562ZTH3_9BURK|nr:hypothetical protein [Caenimonas sedimenti]TWO71910.1 hypothetical protein FN976_07925 [Caenimonas sedimenti]